jgi:nicotinamide mononucleotide adenylyltransferase
MISFIQYFIEYYNEMILVLGLNQTSHEVKNANINHININSIEKALFDNFR